MIEIVAEPEWVRGRYKLIAASNTVKKEWSSFVTRSTANAKVAFERLTTYPRDHIPNRQFPLKGRALKPYWEYEATKADRLWYVVDAAEWRVIMAAIRNDLHVGAKLQALLSSRETAVQTAMASIPAPVKKKPTKG